MRCGRTKATRHPSDLNGNQIYEIAKFRCESFTRSDRIGRFLAHRIAPGARQLRLAGAAHSCQSAEPGGRKRQRDRARGKALRRKLHDVSRPHRKRRRTRCGSLGKEAGQFSGTHPSRRNRWGAVLENHGGKIADDFVEGISDGDAAMGSCELHQDVRGQVRPRRSQLS
jgi:hypothetical protein